MKDHAIYMRRALRLAAQGTKAVKDNPKVGAVLVHDGRIIGEGFHEIHGQGHAEVNCINSVKNNDKHLISDATIYITLEPCFHEGKTPPCVDLIIKNKIKEVVIGAVDPNPKVSGKSISKLKSLGIKVTQGILEDECKALIQPFIRMMSKYPWVQLKFAKSKHNYMASNEGQVWLSTPASKLLVHRMRDKVDGIMIGTNTALIDDPALTTRLIDGDSPVRIVLDSKGILPQDLKVLSDGNPTIYVTSVDRILPSNVTLLVHDFDQENHLQNLLAELYKLGIYRLMVEGGATLLKSFAKEKLWDEALVINTLHELNEGKKAPNLMGKLISQIDIDTDTIQRIRR